jgi:hypothetical protein
MARIGCREMPAAVSERDDVLYQSDHGGAEHELDSSPLFGFRGRQAAMARRFGRDRTARRRTQRRAPPDQARG